MRVLNALLIGVPVLLALSQPETSPSSPENAAQAELAPRAVLPPEDRVINADQNKRYYLHRPEGEAPDGGWPLLVVLPGGDGSAEFRGFVNAIATHALEGRYLVAQPVAPGWSDDDDRIVWPTTGSPNPNMAFPMETFLDEIHEELSAEFELDPSRCYLMGWSSGGPPCYYAALREETPFRGAFVAMSVYKPQNLPRRRTAEGKAFYILHSPEDFIAMRFPKLAERQLRARGASTTLVTYEGGHGWHGDVHAMIADAIAWLEQHSE